MPFLLVEPGAWSHQASGIATASQQGDQVELSAPKCLLFRTKIFYLKKPYELPEYILKGVIKDVVG